LKKKKKKLKKWSIAKWKKEAKQVFQKYCRLRDADKNGYVKCCTCPKTGYWEKDGFDGGHFIRSNHSFMCFDERNVHAQCKRCNNFLRGNWEAYAKFIKDTYGEEVLFYLIDKSTKIRIRSVDEYQEIINKYKDIIKKLVTMKGIGNEEELYL